MQNPMPPVPRHPAPVHAGIEASLTVELASVVAGARRRALRDGDRQIDTAHLLHSLLESDAEVRAAVGDGAQVARVLGYLVQRSIGYGLRWQGSVEGSGVLPLVRAAAAVPGWSPSAVAAMTGALARAQTRGDPRARGIDVLARVVTDAGCRAVDVLCRAGVDTAQVGERIAAASRHASRG
ncbi:ATP-dependent Clp protease ATP-binding subunit ClpA [Streptomyces sp. V4I23]|uniref:Clp protease N-terminal domain-containing protein n=1 Tax=Streptomyces sp. V4I23 TaxID=3042282 RepID=UPI002781F1E2|nr:Clp protease N-terminal domain-containing protein [Streptomyces sp. V4I23]MDQ1012044.1 ATP-dependent Clp protease ATP-binding subunit ClpA [Streptomyces sp. V4I23]